MRSREEMASFFDPYINIVLDGLSKTIKNLLLDVNVGLYVIRKGDWWSYIEQTENSVGRWFYRVALCIFKNRSMV